MNRLEQLTEFWQGLEPRMRRLVGITTASLLGLLLLLSFLNGRIENMEMRRSGRERDLAEMLVLKQRLLSARAGAQMFTSRLAATRPDDSPARIIEETGIKGKSIKVSPLKAESANEFILDMAEVRVEGVTANEAVNLIYRLEKGTRPVLIKKAFLKTRFDDPARLDLIMTVALVKGAASTR